LYSEVKEKIEETMLKHDDYLQSIGMKTNVAKTELIYYSRKTINTTPITVKGANISPSKTMKVLGIKFDEHLTWEAQIKDLKRKAMHVINKLKFLSKFINKDIMKRVVTSHFFGMIYYASPVWMNETTTATHWKTLNSLHYRALRSSVRDFTFKWSKDDLNNYFKRATPLKWMRYTCCKMAINLYLLNQAGPPMSTRLRRSAYINDRQPHKVHFMDTSQLKIGKQSLANRLSSMKTIKFDWASGIDKHKLRIELKKTFVDSVIPVL